ncbi:MAG TPA: signal recognition particle receptor subunit alpha, partial [Pirellulales bacterium]|nr:signal recognition particle receptor subunit alpha [Pirellulales bacterium]
MGFFDKLKEGLRKTSRVLNTDVRDLFKSQGRLVDDAFLEELYAILIKTDMGTASAREAVDEVRSAFRGRVVEMSDLLATVKQKLRAILAQAPSPLTFADSGPTVILVAGVNGAGKTTSIAKLTAFCQAAGKKVVLGAGDTFRAAA